MAVHTEALPMHTGTILMHDRTILLCIRTTLVYTRTVPVHTKTILLYTKMVFVFGSADLGVVLGRKTRKTRAARRNPLKNLLPAGSIGQHARKVGSSAQSSQSSAANRSGTYVSVT